MATIEQVRVPDIGDFDAVDVIEVLVSAGDQVEQEQSLITLESDKASLEVPSPIAGTIKEINVAVGDKVSEGDLVATLEVTATGSADSDTEASAKADQPPPAGTDNDHQAEVETRKTTETPSPAADEAFSRDTDSATPDTATATADAGPRPAPATGDVPNTPTPVHASPAVRKFARELGVDLARVEGSGPRGRIMREDVQAFVKGVIGQGGARQAVPGMTPPPAVDFSRFGATERIPLSRIQRKAGPHLQRSWASIPHVTQFEEADVTEIERLRKALQGDAGRHGVKLTMLAILLNVCATALREFPRINSSLDPDGEHLILKQYVNIGVAVDTPDGLLVPVIREADRKGIYQLARETAELAELARDGKLKPDHLQGGCFSISSLGGIGGTAFTPIINAPEVGILGVSRTQTRPVYTDGQWQPRLMLPLSFSYDHRVIDGAEAARFTTHLATLLADPHQLSL